MFTLSIPLFQLISDKIMVRLRNILKATSINGRYVNSDSAQLVPTYDNFESQIPFLKNVRIEKGVVNEDAVFNLTSEGINGEPVQQLLDAFPNIISTKTINHAQNKDLKFRAYH